jgi:hypothetical protein
MQEPKKTGSNDTLEDSNRIDPPAAEPGLWLRIRRLLNSAPPRPHDAKRELARDRTRSLSLLIAGTVGALVLFIGVFSTPTTPTDRRLSVWSENLSLTIHAARS